MLREIVQQCKVPSYANLHWNGSVKVKLNCFNLIIYWGVFFCKFLRIDHPYK